MEYKFTDTEIRLIKESFEKACTKEYGTFYLMYDRLFELDPDAVKLFKGDIIDQTHKIYTMLKTIVDGLNNVHIIIPAVQEMGGRHV